MRTKENKNPTAPGKGVQPSDAFLILERIECIITELVKNGKMKKGEKYGKVNKARSS